jgi:hypothetical protein
VNARSLVSFPTDLDRTHKYESLDAGACGLTSKIFAGLDIDPMKIARLPAHGMHMRSEVHDHLTSCKRLAPVGIRTDVADHYRLRMHLTARYALHGYCMSAR